MFKMFKKRRLKEKLSESKGIYTVEATLIMIITVMTIASVIVFAMFLRSRVSAGAEIRNELELSEKEMFKENKLYVSKSLSDGKEVKITEKESASYNEIAEKTIINIPKSLRIIRLISIITEKE